MKEKTDRFYTFDMMTCENADPFTRQSFLSIPSPNLISAGTLIIREREDILSQ